MRIAQMPIGDLIPYARNARIISPDAVNKVAASLKEYGWRQPIVVDEQHVIIVGHTRLQAAHKLGLDTVPVHIAEGMSNAQVKAYRLADNRTGEQTEWDKDLLAIELGEFDMSMPEVAALTAFDVDEIEELAFGQEEGDEQEGESESYDSVFSIIVDCENEIQQEVAYNLLEERGYKCKIQSI